MNKIILLIVLVNLCACSKAKNNKKNEDVNLITTSQAESVPTTISNVIPNQQENQKVPANPKSSVEPPKQQLAHVYDQIDFDDDMLLISLEPKNATVKSEIQEKIDILQRIRSNIKFKNEKTIQALVKCSNFEKEMLLPIRVLCLSTLSFFNDLSVSKYRNDVAQTIMKGLSEADFNNVYVRVSLYPILINNSALLKDFVEIQNSILGVLNKITDDDQYSNPIEQSIFFAITFNVNDLIALKLEHMMFKPKINSYLLAKQIQKIELKSDENGIKISFVEFKIKEAIKNRENFDYPHFEFFNLLLKNGRSNEFLFLEKYAEDIKNLSNAMNTKEKDFYRAINATDIYERIYNFYSVKAKGV